MDLHIGINPECAQYPVVVEYMSSHAYNWLAYHQELVPETVLFENVPGKDV